MASSTWKFIRHNDINGFLSANRPSTDAINALNAWRQHYQTSPRTYQIIDEANDFIKAVLTYDDLDNRSGIELDKYCLENGIKREKIS